MTWGESLQCRIVRVGVSQCPTGGWRKHQGTQNLLTAVPPSFKIVEFWQLLNHLHSRQLNFICCCSTFIQYNETLVVAAQYPFNTSELWQWLQNIHAIQHNLGSCCMIFIQNNRILAAVYNIHSGQ
jgi:hypothetical protein